MFRQSGDNSNAKSFNKCTFTSAWIALAFSTLVFFGSLIVIVWIVTYNYPIKWTFSVYIVAAGSLFLTNVLSNALIISSKQKPTEEERISMRSSMIRRRLVEELENRISTEAPQGFCHQEVQTCGVTKTPPPPYEDLPNGNAETNRQLPSNEAQTAESPEDVKQLLNKILQAINTSKILKKQLSEPKCDKCKTRIYEAGILTASQQNRSTQAASADAGIYPQLPNEVLEHMGDPNEFIKALAKYQTDNRRKQYEENRKRKEENRKNLQKDNRKSQFANKETSKFQAQAGQNLVVANVRNNLNQVSNEQISTEPVNNTTLKEPSQNWQRLSPSNYLKQKVKAKNQRSEQSCSSVNTAKTVQDLGYLNPIRIFDRTDKSRSLSTGAQPQLGSLNALNSKQNLTFTKSHEVLQNDLGASSEVSRSIPTMIQTGMSLSEDRRSKSPQDIDSANQIGIPLKDYPLRKSTRIVNRLVSGSSANSTSSEDSSLTHVEHGQALGHADKPMEGMFSYCALHGQQLSSAAMRHFGSSSNSLPEQTFSNESDYQNLNPEKWLAAWERGFNNLSRENSTLFGARL